MKLYDSPVAPNPRRVRIFLAEKGIVVPTENVDLARLEQKSPAYAAVNPLLRIPALELDSGEIISEIRGDLPLFRGDPARSAAVRARSAGKGARRNVAAPRRAGLFLSHRTCLPPQPSRHGRDGKAADSATGRTEPAARPRLRAVPRFRNWRPGASSREMCFTIADITAEVAADFAAPARIKFPDELVHFARWRAEVSGRPSSKA